MNNCDLHRLIDVAFASSTFARHVRHLLQFLILLITEYIVVALQALDEYMEPSQLPTAIRRSPRKADKKPVYVLNITIPPREVDNCVEPAKTTVTLQVKFTILAFIMPF